MRISFRCYNDTFYQVEHLKKVVNDFESLDKEKNENFRVPRKLKCFFKLFNNKTLRLESQRRGLSLIE